MKLSISNIGWEEKNDAAVYDLMRANGFKGLEIAPTRVFGKDPYDQLEKAGQWAEKLEFDVPSMQSIWYGISGNIFEDADRDMLISYTKKAILFAQKIGCRNLVFGCPRCRSIPKDKTVDDAVAFFRELGDYAYEHDTVIAMEANPPIYNTNFINRTEDAFDLISRVGSKGFLLNLDVGTMIENGESVDMLKGRTHLINHVHVSEPYMKPVCKRDLHNELSDLLRASGYDRYVSIEVATIDDMAVIASMIEYVGDVFG
jgi:sugar phosphate isomerase/epimerase